MRDETERYFRSAAVANTSYYNALLELASIYNTPFFENAGKAGEPRAAGSALRDRGGVIELRGSVGDEATNAFHVHHSDSSRDSEDVAFVVSEFRGPPGIPAVTPPLRLQPPRFILARSESQLVSVRLPLVPDLFVANQRYTATLTVQKRDSIDLTIDVIVRAPPDVAASSAATSSGGAA